MSPHDGTLTTMRDNARFCLYNDIEPFEGSDDPEVLAAGFTMVAKYQRVLAVTRMAQDGSLRGFQVGLQRAALAWQALFQRLNGRLPISHRLLRGSQWYPLLGAIAAGDLELAKALIPFAPTECEPELEYEDEWLWCMAIVPLVQGAAGADLEALRDRWAEACDGNAMGGPNLIDALLANDGKAFAKALREMVTIHRDRVERQLLGPGGNSEAAALQSVLCVEALAYCRIGREYGLTVSEEIPLVPALARVTEVPEALPADDWRNFDIQ